MVTWKLALALVVLVIGAFVVYRQLDEPDTVPAKIANWLGPECDVYDAPANLLREFGFSARAVYNAKDVKTVGCENAGPGTSYLRYGTHRELVWVLSEPANKRRMPVCVLASEVFEGGVLDGGLPEFCDRLGGRIQVLTGHRTYPRPTK